MESLLITFIIGLGMFGLYSAVKAGLSLTPPPKNPQLRNLLPEGDWKPSPFGLKGKVGRLTVTISIGQGSQESVPNQVQITDWSRIIPLGLALTAKSRLSVFPRGEELETGDEEFDDSVRIWGQADEVAALFSSEVRRLVTRFQKSGKLKVKLRNVTWSYRSEFARNPERLAACVRRLIELARMLQLPAGEVPRRLAENAQSDPVPGVQLVCLRLLLELHGESEPARQAAEALIESDLPWFRLRAARHLGAPKGIPVLRSLFNTLTSNVDLRREALVALVPLLPRNEALSLLTETMSHPQPVESLLVTAVQEAGRLELKEAAPTLIDKVAGAKGEVLDALADTLAILGDSSAEEVLLPKLAASAKAPSAAVVRALGNTGSAASVEPLLRVTRSRSSSRDLKAAAHEAIARIQSRLAGAEAGQLSLSETTGTQGALSIAEEMGKLAVVEPESKQPPSEDR